MIKTDTRFPKNKNIRNKKDKSDKGENTRGGLMTQGLFPFGSNVLYLSRYLACPDENRRVV